jgi:hypothetical protein
VQNTGDFSLRPVLIGSPENQTSELNTVLSTVSPTELGLASPTRLDHNNGDQVLSLLGNYLRIYTAPDTSGGIGTQPDDSAFTLLAGGTIAIDDSRATTVFTDNASPSNVWYKYTFYNPSDGSESALASSRAVQAGAIHYASLDQIRRAASLTQNSHVSDDLIAEYRDAAEREVNGALQAVYQLPLPQPINPIIVQIVKNIAAGELMQEVYSPVAPAMVAMGREKAVHGRDGDGESVTGLAQLTDRSVVLQDAKFAELTINEAHGFGGYPDATTAILSSIAGGDNGFDFTVNRIW